MAQTSGPYAAAELGRLLWRRRGEPDAVQAFALAMVLDVGTAPVALHPRVADTAADYAVGLQ